MALPTKLRAARLTDDSIGTLIDNAIGEVEVAVAEIFGFTPDVDITESPLGCDNAGRITKALLRQKAAAPVGWRFRDVTGGKELAVYNDGTNLIVAENTGTEDIPVWTERARMVIATGIWTYTAIPVGPAEDPTTVNQLSRKAYVDTKVSLTGNESVAGIKTFGSIPVLPASDPTTDNQAARKAYVDSRVFAPSTALLQNRQAQNTGGGTATSGSWGTIPLNTEQEDTDSIVDSSALPAFSLGAGTYMIQASSAFMNVTDCQMRLYNVTDAEVTIVGPSCLMSNDDSIQSNLIGTFTIAGTKQFRLEYRVSVTFATYGLGSPANFGTEVYQQVFITKLS